MEEGQHLRSRIDWSNPINRNLQLWYPCNEGAGGKITDLVNINNVGVLNGATWPNYPSYIGATSSWTNIDNDGKILISTTRPFSISLWFFKNAFTQQYPLLVEFKTDIGNGYNLSCSNQASYLGVYFGASSSFARLKTDIPSANLLNKWINVVITYNGNAAGTSSNYKCYVDGVEQTLTGAGAIGASGNMSRIGGHSSSAVQCFNGQICDVKLWNRVIGSDEAKKLSNQSFLGMIKNDLYKYYQASGIDTTKFFYMFK